MADARSRSAEDGPGGGRGPGSGRLVAGIQQQLSAVSQGSSGRPWTTAGLLLAGLGLVMFPIGGIVGAVCGAIGFSRGDRARGVLTIVASLVSFVLSFVVAAIVLRRFL